MLSKLVQAIRPLGSRIKTFLIHGRLCRQTSTHQAAGIAKPCTRQINLRARFQDRLDR